MSSAYIDVPDGTCFKRVYATLEPQDISISANSVIARDAHPVDIYIEGKGECIACCTKGLHRYAAWAVKEIDSLIGVSAEIETFWGQLCPEDTKEAQTGAWVGFQNDLPPATRTNFAQIGYIKKRWPGGTVDSSVYVEFVGWIHQWDRICFLTTDPAFPGAYVAPPAHGDFHDYRVEISSSGGGDLVFSFDGVIIFNVEAPWWQGKTSRYASWRGEIDGRETDMPGTKTNPCEFNDCKYLQKDGAWAWANFGESGDWIDVTPQMNDPDQWGIWYDQGGHEMTIWDEYPLGEYKTMRRVSR